ncbi:hypothetical protein IWZ00DRAFT_63446 [Phyllosticta capitalensis]
MRRVLWPVTRQGEVNAAASTRAVAANLAVTIRVRLDGRIWHWEDGYGVVLRRERVCAKRKKAPSSRGDLFPPLLTTTTALPFCGKQFRIAAQAGWIHVPMEGQATHGHEVHEPSGRRRACRPAELGAGTGSWIFFRIDVVHRLTQQSGHLHSPWPAVVDPSPGSPLQALGSPGLAVPPCRPIVDLDTRKGGGRWAAIHAPHALLLT